MGPSDIMEPRAVTIGLRESAAAFLALTAEAATGFRHQIATRGRAMMAILCGASLTFGEALQRLNRLQAAAY